jgi:biotin transporter BioY
MLRMIVAAAVDGFGVALRRAMMRLQLTLVAVAMALIGLVFVAIAGDLWLAPRLGAPGAALAVGAILFVIAGLLLLLSGAMGSPRSAGSTSALTRAIEAELRAMAQPLAIAALIAGFLAARAPSREGKDDRA